MKRIIIYITLSLLLLSSCELNITSDANGRVYIVTVGIDYANTAVNDLDGTVNDALEIAECFRDVYEGRNTGVVMRRMVQEGPDSDRTSYLYPSTDNILRMLQTIDPTPDDLVVFFYSGHGDVHLSEETGAILSNFLAAAPDMEEGDRSLYTELDTDVLFSALEALPCPAVAIIDACYSGGAADNYTSPSFTDSFRTIVEGMDLRGTAVIAASLPDQLSYVSSTTTEEGEIERHSYLTLSVLEELGWRHSSTEDRLVEVDGKIKRVYGYLRTQPEAMTAEDLFNAIDRSWRVANQTPCYGGSPAGIYIIPRG